VGGKNPGQDSKNSSGHGNDNIMQREHKESLRGVDFVWVPNGKKKKKKNIVMSCYRTKLWE